MTPLYMLLEHNLSTIFNQRDRRKRAAALEKLWAVDGVLWSAEGTYFGHAEIDRSANDLLRRLISPRLGRWMKFPVWREYVGLSVRSELRRP